MILSQTMHELNIMEEIFNIITHKRSPNHPLRDEWINELTFLLLNKALNKVIVAYYLKENYFLESFIISINYGSKKEEDNKLLHSLNRFLNLLIDLPENIYLTLRVFHFNNDLNFFKKEKDIFYLRGDVKILDGLVVKRNDIKYSISLKCISCCYIKSESFILKIISLEKIMKKDKIKEDKICSQINIKKTNEEKSFINQRRKRKSKNDKLFLTNKKIIQKSREELNLQPKENENILNKIKENILYLNKSTQEKEIEVERERLDSQSTFNSQLTVVTKKISNIFSKRDANSAIVNCICGINICDGDMLFCDGCSTWLHTVCCGFFSNTDKRIPKGEYYCFFCMRKNKFLSQEKSNYYEQKKLALYRRVLSMTYNEGIDNPITLSRRIGISYSNSVQYIKQLIYDGFLIKESKRYLIQKNQSIKNRLKEYFTVVGGELI